MASPLNETLPVNRKLIRPSLAEVRDQLARQTPLTAAAPAPAHSPAHAPGQLPAPGHFPPRLPKKPIPPEQTNAESFYFLKQMQTKTEMVLVLRDGERIQGVIEWYDRHCLKVHRAGDPNLLIYKDTIKYMYKLEDETRAAK